MKHTSFNVKTMSAVDISIWTYLRLVSSGGTVVSKRLFDTAKIKVVCSHMHEPLLFPHYMPLLTSPNDVMRISSTSSA